MDEPQDLDATNPFGAMGGTQCIRRVGALLRSVSRNDRDGSRLVDLYRPLELERSTAYRILQALICEGLVTQDDSSRRYHVGPLIHELASLSRARPHSWNPRYGISHFFASGSGVEHTSKAPGVDQ